VLDVGEPPCTCVVGALFKSFPSGICVELTMVPVLHTVRYVDRSLLGLRGKLKS